jgi:uncharacterized repeat protein (TIGR01451 family)
MLCFCVEGVRSVVVCAESRFIYVSQANDGLEDGTSAHPYNTISEALAVAEEGDEIRVAGAAGSAYHELLLVDKPVHLLGGYDPESWQRNILLYETVIDGSASGTVVTIGPWATSRDVLFEGFMIRNGNGTRGGGIFVTQAAPTIRHNRISGNVAQSGGGIALMDASASIWDNFIEMNIARGGGGGGIYASGAQTIIARNQIIGNDATTDDGGGVKIADGSVAMLIGNRLVSNSARHGGGIYVSGAAIARIWNAILYLNMAGGAGGGLAVDGGTVEVVNSTLFQNMSDGLYVAAGSVSVQNSILWGHGGRDVTGEGVNISFCDVEQAVLTGAGNISIEPLLSNPQSLDFHLLPTSPLVDAGGSDIALSSDFEEDTRFYDGDGDGVPRPDIGADEVAANLSQSEIAIAHPALHTPGGSLTLMITLTNSGQVDVAEGWLTDTLSGLLTYRPDTLRASTGSAWYADGAIYWHGPISLSTPVTLTFAVNIAESAEVGQSVSNEFEVAYGSNQIWRSQPAAVTLVPRRAVWLPQLLRNKRP